MILYHRFYKGGSIIHDTQFKNVNLFSYWLQTHSITVTQMWWKIERKERLVLFTFPEKTWLCCFRYRENAVARHHDQKGAPPPFSVTHKPSAVSYHVTAQRLLAISSTQKHLVLRLHLMDHSDVIATVLNDKRKRVWCVRGSQQSVMIRYRL